MLRKSLRLLTAALVALTVPHAVNAQEGEPGAYAAAVTSQTALSAGHFALVAAYADQFLKSGPGGHRTVYAQSLMDGIDDPAKADEIGDYFLLDIRRPADFAAGHIAGAVNVQFADVADPGTLAVLPLDRPILVICYTGHTASVANGLLGALGYDAWTLRFGMTSWKAASATAVWSPAGAAKQTIYGGGYPVTAPAP